MQEKMVTTSFIGLIAVLLMFLQAMESFSLNLEDIEQSHIVAKKRSIAHEDHELKGRKMMMKKDGMKSSEISADLSSIKSTKTGSDYRIEKRKLRGVSESYVNSHQSNSKAIGYKFESLNADYSHPTPHPPGHN